ncbi:hypothetical protein BS47DRAFT_1400801 [Hydnum rufescens UP504]|uniref:Sodium/calcium exchanger membrane region domain-containing protein n=1 Tax=Hydnum rufescens UP504 TaxID=1448309 RepID=A0A9P6AGQ6_9AGAM|nr:hypothetical protein BS47DRAFT_1400801 [Hydnum rufescens UP504]
MEPRAVRCSEEVPLTTLTSEYGVPLEPTPTLVDSDLADETGREHPHTTSHKYWVCRALDSSDEHLLAKAEGRGSARANLVGKLEGHYYEFLAQRSPRIRAPRMDSSFLEVVRVPNIWMWKTLADFGGESFALYCGKSLGDLVVITLDNVVEVCLAIILLTRCELRLVQSTACGVILLHTLLVPGISFMLGGVNVLHQHLDPHVTELNKSVRLLLERTVGSTTQSSHLQTASYDRCAPRTVSRAEVNAPADPGVLATLNEETVGAVSAISDASRNELLKLSRGMAIILLIICEKLTFPTNTAQYSILSLPDVASRIYLYNPPGDENHLTARADVHPALKEKETRMGLEEPKMNPWVCLILFLIVVPLTAASAEWLVASLEHIRKTSRVKQEWFGLIFLPVVSFAARALVAMIYFVQKLSFLKPEPPEMLAQGPYGVSSCWRRVIDLPEALADFFEVAVVIGACFLVNNVTDDAKTNWVEGFILLSFYIMIATAAWFYDGQQSLDAMSFCETVSSVLAIHSSTAAT